MAHDDSKGQPPVEFTLDGVAHRSEDRKMPASEVLRTFGGLDSSNYDLIRLEGRTEHRYSDADEVQLVPGGKYVSFFTGSMPVE